MGIKEEIDRLEGSSEFSIWRKANKEAYLAHAFTMREAGGLEGWQLGYFNRSSQRVTIFEMEKEIIVQPESEVFKREETEVKALELARVKIGAEEAIEIAGRLCKEDYPQIISSKQIVILQNIELGQLWNITFVSRTMDVLNIKVDAENGNVLSHNLSRLFEFSNVKKDDEDSLE